MFLRDTNVGGNLKFSKNNLKTAFIGQNNVIGGNLDCSDNTSNFPLFRGGNTVVGNAVDQCAGLKKVI